MLHNYFPIFEVRLSPHLSHVSNTKAQARQRNSPSSYRGNGVEDPTSTSCDVCRSSLAALNGGGEYEDIRTAKHVMICEYPRIRRGRRNNLAGTFLKALRGIDLVDQLR